MILDTIFGNKGKIKILEELSEHWGEYLTVDELVRMTELSKNTVLHHLRELGEIDLVITKPETVKKFSLNTNDKRALALGILTDEECLRKMKLAGE